MTSGGNAWITASFLQGRAMILITDAMTHATAQGVVPGSNILEFQAEFGSGFRQEALTGTGPPAGLVVYESQGIAALHFAGALDKRILVVFVFKKP